MIDEIFIKAVIKSLDDSAERHSYRADNTIMEKERAASNVSAKILYSISYALSAGLHEAKKNPDLSTGVGDVGNAEPSD